MRKTLLAVCLAAGGMTTMVWAAPPGSPTPGNPATGTPAPETGGAGNAVAEPAAAPTPVPDGAGAHADAHAQAHPRHGGWVIVTPVDPGNSSVAVVQRPVVAPSAMISRGLHEQPVWNFLAEVHVVGTTTFIDPLADYKYTGEGALDDNHWILRAQRQFISEHTDTTAYVIAGSPDHPMIGHIQPAMIFMKPDGLQVPHDNFTPRTIPNAPVDSDAKPKVAMTP